MASYVYKGTAFPWDGTLETFIKPKSDVDVLRTSIQMILFTRVGERVMLRDFGSNIEQRVFDQNDLFLRNEFLQELQEAVARWDDRIGIENFNIVQQDDVFQCSVVFFNAKDPLKATSELTVTLGDAGFQTVG